MEKAELIWMDGALVPWDEARVHVLSHTLHYGLGVFEGIRCYRCEDGQSRIFRLNEHVTRLEQSAQILGMDNPWRADAVVSACLETVKANRLEECYLRPLLFIGEGEMGLAAAGNPVHLSVAVWPWGAYLGEDGLSNGIRVKTSSFQRYHVNSLMTKAKAVGHYVNSILASVEARNAGYDESLMLDVDGYAAEGCGENLFIARGGRVKTPPIATILEGITRDTAITLLRARGIEVVEERFTRDEVYIADEAWLTGTAAEITPIASLDDRRVGPGKPGPITLKLQEEFFEIIKGKRSGYEHWLTTVEF
ncbi:MAG: branched-chain amino acid transaminase [Candidatus Binatia bacterium]